MGMSRDDGSEPYLGEPPAYDAAGASAYWSPAPPPSDAGSEPYPSSVPPTDPAPDHQRRTLAILGTVGVALVAAIVVAIVLVVRVLDADPTSEDPAVASQTPSAEPVRECTQGVSDGEVPESGAVSAGGLSFPRSVAPEWQPKAEHRVPNSVDAISLEAEISDMTDMTWIGQLTVGVTNVDQDMSLTDQARLMLKCVVESELYERASPFVGEVTPKPGRLDGVPTVTIEVPISVVIPDPAITGDDLVLVIVGTRPSTYFLATTPFGDVERQAVVRAAMEGLRVSPV
ncbi:hypothetical protein [Mycolicibacterium sediminis]|nr:hypothetical protein [Mycolicibacterium sediminis]